MNETTKPAPLDREIVERAIEELKRRYDFSVVDGVALLMLPDKMKIPQALMDDSYFVERFTALCGISERSKMAVRQFAETWRENILDNLASEMLFDGSPISSLFGKAKKQPAIVVSAGPSLDDNIMQLRAAQGKALIFVVDTALKTVMGHGITPDYVVSICAAPDNLRDFDGLIMPPETSLMYLPSISPVIVGQFHKLIPFSNGHPLIEWLWRSIGVDFGFINSQGSVSTCAFDIAVKMGCDPIILAGQDLAFTRGRSHTDGSPLAHDEVGQVEVDAITGGKIKTSPQMLAWLRWFEAEIPRTEATVINATAGGARIKGAIKMRLDSAVKAFCRFKVEAPAGERFADGIGAIAQSKLASATDDELALMHLWELGAFGRPPALAPRPARHRAVAPGRLGLALALGRAATTAKSGGY